MAHMILTYEIRPEDGDVEYSKLEEVTKLTIKNFDSTVNIKYMKEKPMGFGLKAVEINFSIDEKYGTDAIEEALKAKKEIGDAICLSMSRALG